MTEILRDPLGLPMTVLLTWLSWFGLLADEAGVRTRLPQLVNGLTEVSQLGVFPLGRHGNLLQPLGHVGQGLLESLHHLGVGRQLGRQTQHLK